MLFFVALKLVAVAYAALYSIKSRFNLGMAAVIALLYLTLARGLSVIPPYVKLPLSGWLGSSWWWFPLLVTGISAAATVVSFKTADALTQGAPRQQHVQKAAFAFLGNSLLDLGLLTILFVAYTLAYRDAL